MRGDYTELSTSSAVVRQSRCDLVFDHSLFFCQGRTAGRRAAARILLYMVCPTRHANYEYALYVSFYCILNILLLVLYGLRTAATRGTSIQNEKTTPHQVQYPYSRYFPGLCTR